MRAPECYRIFSHFQFWYQFRVSAHPCVVFLCPYTIFPSVLAHVFLRPAHQPSLPVNPLFSFFLFTQFPFDGCTARLRCAVANRCFCLSRAGGPMRGLLCKERTMLPARLESLFTLGMSQWAHLAAFPHGQLGAFSKMMSLVLANAAGNIGTGV